MKTKLKLNVKEYFYLGASDWISFCIILKIIYFKSVTEITIMASNNFKSKKNVNQIFIHVPYVSIGKKKKSKGKKWILIDT